jgi:hypothetical protein
MWIYIEESRFEREFEVKKAQSSVFLLYPSHRQEVPHIYMYYIMHALISLLLQQLRSYLSAEEMKSHVYSIYQQYLLRYQCRL